MKKGNQSLLDFLGNAPKASFMVQRSLISNKEAKTLYSIWQDGNKDEYGKHIVDDKIDSMEIVSLTTKGYVRNNPTRYGGFPGGRYREPILVEFTNKGKDVIKKIILHQEKSAFEKESQTIDYEAICRKATIQEFSSGQKVASKQKNPQNWLGRVLNGSNTTIQ